MSDEILNFREVATQQAADEIVVLLDKNGISSKIIKESFNPASTFSEGSLSSNFTIQIHSKDKEKAEALMSEEAKKFLSEIDPEHYLFSFTDEELIDVLVKKYEWSDLDVLLSQKILEDRGVEYSSKDIQSKQAQRLKELSIPKKGHPIWIVLGYLTAFLGGLLGLIIAYSVYKAKRKLPDGTTVKEYDENTRKHALIIFIISVIVFSVAFVILYAGDTTSL